MKISILVSFVLRTILHIYCIHSLLRIQFCSTVSWWQAGCVVSIERRQITSSEVPPNKRCCHHLRESHTRFLVRGQLFFMHDIRAERWINKNG
ncbi:hypothetical protein DFH29DRAFT_405699 [Suillus ampliporus]|nr:hypothetical protein DFH29DRAFT_405699 [Suillus ampliporus]